jgi:dTDP-4-dehydrorhamnose reductase
MTILVVGSSGQVAQSLVAAGRVAGADVVALGRPELDLAHTASLQAVMGRVRPAVIINAAAYTTVDRAESEPDAAHAINAAGAGRLAEHCARAGVPLVHLSTDYVFDGHKVGAYTEADAVAPINAYGRSKLVGEVLVAAKCPQHIVVRTSWVFSRHGTNFVRTMLRLAESRREVRVVDDQVGCPTYAPHLAEVVLALAHRLAGRASTTPDSIWGIYHAAGHGETTWCGFAHEIFRCSARGGGPKAAVRPVRSQDFPTVAARPRNSRLDCSKLARVFGLALPDWQDGVAACVAELMEPGPQGRGTSLAAAASGEYR